MSAKQFLPALICTFTLLATGCSESKDTTASNPTPTEVAVTIPASFFQEIRPTTAPNLIAVKETAQAGEDVVFLARIGGRAKPFADGFAMFVVADPSLVSCELMGDEDHCAVPYDYCCEAPEKIKAGLATIQFSDEDGMPYRTTAQGAGGLEGSKFVVVKGTVLERNDEGLFTIEASKVWVGGKPDRADPMKGSGLASSGPIKVTPNHVPHDHDGDGVADH
ncbi:MAG: hypothetical protein MK085_10190 [Phycisphaerales bacterium]|nr:hypothetical protein [Phycisphaerales bacterium]